MGVDYPDDWYFVASPVTSLVIPHQLFAVSNRPIVITAARSPISKPSIRGLDSGALFIWSYYQVLGELDPTRTLVPNYSGYSLPLSYAESRAFPSTDARGWAPGQFIWRHIGFDQFGVAVTVFIWEATQVGPGDIRKADAILHSIRVA